MNHIVLYQPQIPPNTGNIARTCAATNTTLHLIHPLGFSVEDKYVKRSGLDYWEHVDVVHHDSLDDFLASLPQDAQLHLITKFAYQRYDECDYKSSGDNYFIFGQETKGLPESFMKAYKAQCLRVPMNDTFVRSLNLSNVAALVLYEALRQQEFPNMDLVYHYEHDKLKDN